MYSGQVERCRRHMKQEVGLNSLSIFVDFFCRSDGAYAFRISATFLSFRARSVAIAYPYSRWVF